MPRNFRLSFRSLAIVVVVSASISGTIFAKAKTPPPTIQPVLDQTQAAFFTPNDIKWIMGPIVLQPGIEVTLFEGDPNQAGLYTMRFKIPANTDIPAHWNPSDEHVTVISGEYNIGLGDKLDKTKGTALPPGSFERIPAKMNHYAWTTVETIIQLHGQGPWGMIYVNPMDDPSTPLLPAAATPPPIKTPLESTAEKL